MLPHSAHPPQLPPLLSVFSIHAPFRARDRGRSPTFAAAVRHFVASYSADTETGRPPSDNSRQAWYLPDTSPLRAWLRVGLVSELRGRFSAPPAVLLLPTSPVKTALRHSDNRAQGFFGRLLHALACPPSTSALPLAGTGSPAPLSSPFLGLSLSRSTGVPPVGVPPAYIARLGPSPPYHPQPSGAFPRIPWADLWVSLPGPVRASFTALSTAVPSPSSSLSPPLDPDLLWRPLQQDPSFFTFPWVHPSVAGVPLKNASAAWVRAALLVAEEVCIPRRIIDPLAPGLFWANVWAVPEACPLNAETRSACLSALGRNIWTYRKDVLRAWSALLPLARALGIHDDLPMTVANIV
ncbi:hypothetical protein OC842_007560, partial [Tilletia horrida]